MREGRAQGPIQHDSYEYTVPALQYLSESVRAGTLPLWDPYQSCGTPFLAAQQAGALYPPNWIVAFLPLPTAMRVLFFAHAMLAALGAYLCAAAFGLRPSVALLVGLAYASSGSVVNTGEARMFTNFVATAWLPWQVGLLRWALSRRSLGAAIALGAVNALAVTGGHPQYVLMGAIVGALYTTAFAASCSLRGQWRRVGDASKCVALVAVVSICLSAPQLLPTLALTPDTPRRPGALMTDGLGEEGSLSSLRLLAGQILSSGRLLAIHGEGSLPTPVMALLLAGLLSRRFRPLALFFLAVGGLSAAAALGGLTPVYGWIQRLPGAGLFRYPERYLVVWSLCASLLGGFGAETVLRLRRGGSLLWVVASSIVPLAALSLLAWPEAPGTQIQARLWAVGLVGVAACLGLFSLKSPAARWLRQVAALSLLLGAGAQAFPKTPTAMSIPANQTGVIEVPSAAASFIRQRQAWLRTFAPNTPEPGPHLPLKLGLLTGLWSISDYESLLSQRYRDLLSGLGGVWRSPLGPYQAPRLWRVEPSQWPLLRFLGVGFVLVRSDSNLVVDDLPIAYRDADSVVHSLADPLPRAYIAARIRTERDPQAALDFILQEPSFFLDQRGAVVEVTAAPIQGARGSVDIVHYSPERVELRAQLESAGLLVLQDQYASGWTVRIDGEPSQVIRANHAFRGVLVDRGTHLVVFEYRPSGYDIGLLLSGSMLLALFAVGAWKLKKQRLGRKSSW